MTKLNLLFVALNQGIRGKKLVVRVCNTKLIRHILDILLKLGYIASYSLVNVRQINVFFKYDIKGLPSLRLARSISRAGNRIYCKHGCLINKISKISALTTLNGTLILSTSKGVITQEEALKVGVGGEILALII